MLFIHISHIDISTYIELTTVYIFLERYIMCICVGLPAGAYIANMDVWIHFD